MVVELPVCNVTAEGEVARVDTDVVPVAVLSAVVVVKASTAAVPMTIPPMTETDCPMAWGK